MSIIQRVPWTVQPQTAVRLAPWLPAGTLGYIGGQKTLLGGAAYSEVGDIVNTPTTKGVGSKTSTTTSYINAGFVGPLTVGAYTEVIQFVSRDSSAVRQFAGWGTSGTAFQNVAINQNQAGTLAAGKIYFAMRSASGASTLLRVASTNAVVTVGKVHTVAVQCVTGTTGRMFLDGSDVALSYGNSGTFAGLAASSFTLDIGNFNNAGAHTLGTGIDILGFWRIPSNAVDLREATLNPYGYLLAPQTRRIWVLVSAAGASATLTGTATTATEADIVAGGKTIILTLTGDTFVASGATFDAQRANIIAGLDSAQSELLGWDNVVKALQGVSGVVRTSDTVCTITLDAQATYSITADETITATIPASALSGGVAVVAAPTFQVTEGGAYILTADAATFTLTGNAAALRANRKFSATPASYAWTAQDASLLHARRLSAAVAEYTLTGNAATLKAARVLSAAAGSYAWTGNDATLSKSSSYALTADAAAYSWTGQDAALRAARRLTATAASYAFTGNDATLTYTPVGAYSLTADAAAYALTGNDAGLRADRRLSAAAGIYNLTGSAASLLRGYRLAATVQAYAWTGSDATLTKTNVYRLTAAAGAYVWTGSVVTLTYSGQLAPAILGSLAGSTRKIGPTRSNMQTATRSNRHTAIR